MQLCVLLCLATLAASSPLALEEEWQQWKQQHGKTYSSEVEESVRRAVWFRTFHHIQEHNRGSHPYELGLNEFADIVRAVSYRHNCMIYTLIHTIDTKRVSANLFVSYNCAYCKRSYSSTCFQCDIPLKFGLENERICYRSKFQNDFLISSKCIYFCSRLKTKVHVAPPGLSVLVGL